MQTIELGSIEFVSDSEVQLQPTPSIFQVLKSERLDLSGLVSRTPHHVYVPTWVPEPLRFFEAYQQLMPPEPTVLSVSQTYRGAPGEGWIAITQLNAVRRMVVPDPFLATVVGGRVAALISRPGSSSGKDLKALSLFIERDGYLIRVLVHKLSETELVRVTESIQ